MARLNLTLSLLLLAASAWTANASEPCQDRMKFEAQTNGRATAIGTICAGVESDFTDFVVTNRGVPTELMLWSGGGNVVAAMTFGRLLRKLSMDTRVIGPCESACTLLALGGVRRSIAREAFFAVHQFFIDSEIDGKTALSVAQVLTADISQYVEDMGIDGAFVREAARVPGRDTKILPLAALQSYRVINHDVDRTGRKPSDQGASSFFSPTPLLRLD